MLQNIPKEKILEVLREGPTVPNRIVKRLGGDTMLIGAILSTLISKGDVSFSSLKIGGSPLYYIPGDEEKLEQFIDHLNDKDRKTFNTLKQNKVLRDSEQDPLTRVSLRSLKDFAKPFDMEFDGKKELFWVFYTTDAETAREMAVKHHEETSKPVTLMAKNSVQATDTTDTADTERPVIEENKTETDDEDDVETIVTEKETTQEYEVIKQAENMEIHETKETKKPHHEYHGNREKHAHEKTDNKTTGETKGDFLDRLKSHTHSLNLDIISKEKIKKNEYNLVLKNHDTNEYIYCVAKDKKSISEGDLSTAFVFAHNKKMPCMFLTTGHLTKKAEAMTHKEFKDMKIEKI
jgi:hypothetical protein